MTGLVHALHGIARPSHASLVCVAICVIHLIFITLSADGWGMSVLEPARVKNAVERPRPAEAGSVRGLSNPVMCFKPWR
eukprot:6508732-Alexandrium_andersonii.AAC.1